ncbi:MAG: hypothetical protein DRP71_01110 [Verrucomicrobia bacterium]|nr:MAG: hypothetical protein DRP71_01110 [Verrucomicrobiota bacterium]
MNRFFKSARTAFFAGVILLAPISITLLVFSWLVENIGGRFRSYFFFYLPDPLLEKANLVLLWNFLATLIVLILIAILGYLSRYFFGRYVIGIAERVVRTVPFVNAVYGTVKQIVDTFSTQNRAIFTKVALVEFPRAGVYALGFLTNRVKGEIQGRTDDILWNIFVPTTPNPTSGFLVMFPENEITELDMTVGDGMKVIISGGALVPVWNPELSREVDTPISNPTGPAPHRAPGSPGGAELTADTPPST